MISFKEFLEERTISSKKVELIKDDTLLELITKTNLSEFVKQVTSGKYDLEYHELLHRIAYERNYNFKSQRLMVMARVLVNNGLNVDFPNSYGDTALMSAVAYNDKDYAEFLINLGANPNIKNKYGNNACSIARGYEMKSILGCS